MGRSQGMDLEKTPEKGAAEADYTQDFSQDENEDRGNWTGRLDFLLACLGYAVGLGNVWRFPYLCFKNGGAVFLIPYVIMLTFVGMPIFFLELSLGQYTSSGPLTCWEMARGFKGLGVAMVIVSALVGIYYNVIIAWSIYYMFASFTSDLPWKYCGRSWNSPWCEAPEGRGGLLQGINSTCNNIEGLDPDLQGQCLNATDSSVVGIWNKTLAKAELGMEVRTAAAEYLYFNVWQMEQVNGEVTSSIDNLGPIHWELVLCLLLAWVIVCAALIKGVKSSGKVVYFTAVFPYVVLVILLVRGVTLEGHLEGVKFYITNIDYDVLKDAAVWKDAAVQIFFSLSASWGGLIALSSYNRFHNDALRDSIIVSLGNCLTSFFAGFVIFSFLGYMAHSRGVSVKDVVSSGPGLAFIVYPEAVTLIEPYVISPLWAFLFFMMLITLGLDSEFALIETVTTAIFDQWPITRKYKAVCIIGTGAIFFLLGLTMCTSGGQFMLTLIDSYAGGWNVLLISALECICVCYVYGVNRFRYDIRTMLGPKGCGCFPWAMCFPWWAFCWCSLTPIIVIAVMIFSWVKYTPLTDGGYVFPDWANSLGWCMTMVVVLGIVVTPFVLLCITPGTIGERLRSLVKPSKYWGPALPQHRALVNHLPNFEIDPWGTSMEMGTRNTAYEM